MHLSSMSGSMQRREHNLRCDHGAAELIYGCAGADPCDLPLAITTADVTQSFRWTARDRAKLAGRTAFGKAVLGQVDQYARIHNRRETLLHDPLAILAPLVPEARFRPATLTPLPGGRLRKFASSASRPVQVCFEVDRVALKNRLASAMSWVL